MSGLANLWRPAPLLTRLSSALGLSERAFGSASASDASELDGGRGRAAGSATGGGLGSSAPRERGLPASDRKTGDDTKNKSPANMKRARGREHSAGGAEAARLQGAHASRMPGTSAAASQQGRPHAAAGGRQQGQQRGEGQTFSPAWRQPNDKLVKALLGTQWVAEVVDSNDPSKVKEVNLEDVVDISKLINTDMLPLVKYVASHAEMERFASSRMSLQEQHAFIAKLQSVLLRTRTEVSQGEATNERIEGDPNYALEDALASTPLPTPQHAPPAEQVLTGLKAELMATYDMEEEEFEHYKQVTIEEYNEYLPTLLADTPGSQEVQLQALVDVGVPQDHPRYSSIKAKVQVLQGNPGWPHERKVVFVRSLIKALT